MGLHLHDFPNDLHSNPELLFKLNGLEDIMGTYCPISTRMARKIIEKKKSAQKSAWMEQF